MYDPNRPSFLLSLVVLSLLACVLLLPAWPAAAQDFYAELAAGVAIVPDQDLSGGGSAGEVALDPGFAVGGALGVRMSEHFRAEANLSYRRSEVDEITSSGVALEGAGDVGVFAAMANVYFDLLPEAPVIPYLGVGIGVGVVDVNSDDDATALVVDDASAEFAWNLMAGVSIPVQERIALSLGYRYLATTDPQLDATLVGVGRGRVDGEFDVHEVLFGARIGF